MMASTSLQQQQQQQQHLMMTTSSAATAESLRIDAPLEVAPGVYTLPSGTGRLESSMVDSGAAYSENLSLPPEPVGVGAILKVRFNILYGQRHI